MNSAAHLVALGARTPVGLNAASTAAAVRAGISRISAHPHFVDPVGEALSCAYDGLLPPTLQGVPRMLELALHAVTQCLDQLPTNLHLRELPLLLAVPEHRPGFSETDEAKLVAELQAALPSVVRVSVVARGHAGALLALGQAQEWIAKRRAEVCLVGGVESYLEADTIDWLTDQDQLAMSGGRSQFTPGEAAAFVMVANSGVLHTHGKPSGGILRGAHSAQETCLIKTDAINRAKALIACVEGAAAPLKLPEEAIDDTWCDLNGERYRTDEWSQVLLRLPHVFRQKHGVAVSFQTAVSSWGDVGAATGALLAILASRSWERAYSRGERILLVAGSEQGLRSAVVLESGR